MAISFVLNGKPQSVDVDPQMPLLWVLRDTLNLTGSRRMRLPDLVALNFSGECWLQGLSGQTVFA